MATEKPKQPTDAAGATLTPDEGAGQVLLSAISGLKAEDPQFGEKLLGAYAVYAKTIGRQDLLNNVTEILKQSAVGKLDLRKSIAGMVQEISKAARLKDVDAQSADYKNFIDAFYGQKTEREKLRLAMAHEGLGGITSGLRIKGLIGMIMTMIPGLEETGKQWVAEVETQALQVSNSLPHTDRSIARNAGSARIQGNTANIATLLKETLPMLSPKEVAADAGGAVTQMDATTGDVSFGSTPEPRAHSKSVPASRAGASRQASKPAICSSEAGAGLAICEPPAPRP